MPKKKQENRNTSGLRSLRDLSPEEAFAIRSKGGRANAAKREEEKTLKSIIRKIMDAQPELTAEEDALLIRMGISKEKNRQSHARRAPAGPEHARGRYQRV